MNERKDKYICTYTEKKQKSKTNIYLYIKTLKRLNFPGVAITKERKTCLCFFNNLCIISSIFSYL